MRRLEQVTALVVAAGLAVISYWLFFSWAGGGGVRERSAPKPAFAPTGQSVESKDFAEAAELKAPPSP
jgi:hypothetical protein